MKYSHYLNIHKCTLLEIMKALALVDYPSGINQRYF